MSRTIGQLMADFDTIMGERGSVKTAGAAPAATADDDPVKLAERLVRAEHKVASAKTAGVGDPGSYMMDIAKSIAIADTLLNLPTLSKIAAVEEQARAHGHTDVQIEAFFEKNAAAFPLVSILQFMPWMGATD